MLMGSEIMQWYSDAKMPVFLPKEPKIKDELIPKTVAGSPLCHISVGRWMAEADKSLASDERKDRCARVAASVAYRTVELLNAWKDGTYVTTGAIPAKKYTIPGPTQLHRLPRQERTDAAGGGRRQVRFVFTRGGEFVLPAPWFLQQRRLRRRGVVCQRDALGETISDPSRQGARRTRGTVPGACGARA